MTGDVLRIAGKLLTLEEACSAGSVEVQNGRLREAEQIYREVLRRDPGHPRALHALGVVRHRMGDEEQAVALVKKAVRLKPDFADAHNNLGNILKDIGEIDQAVESYRRAVEIRPDFASAHSNLLLAMHYLPRFTPAEIFAESLRFANTHQRGAAAGCGRSVADSGLGKRLRVGYLSPDFRTHSVSYFIAPLLEAHDRGEVEVFCYADVARGDETTGRLQRLSECWRQVFGLPDHELAQLIREDRVDILVDLAGHTAGNRLRVFAAKAAPVQVSWLGYPDTTGLAAMEYRLTDGIADPEGMTEGHYTETLVRLSPTFLCYAPPADAPPCSPLPCQANGFATFGSFNNMAKLTPEVLDLWGRLIGAVPGSRLLLKNPSLRYRSARRRCLEILCGSGISEERIELLPFADSVAQHLELYHRVDISLDPFPYNGTTTTCESLWMGVPVITLAGGNHAARVGASILNTLGLNGLVATTEKEYLEMAASLASEPLRLAEMREGLRERMSLSRLCDADRFAREVERSYRQMWLRYLEREQG